MVSYRKGISLICSSQVHSYGCRLSLGGQAPGAGAGNKQSGSMLKTETGVEVQKLSESVFFMNAESVRSSVC